MCVAELIEDLDRGGELSQRWIGSPHGEIERADLAQYVRFPMPVAEPVRALQRLLEPVVRLVVPPVT